LTGDNIVPAELGIFAEKVRIEQEKPSAAMALASRAAFFSRRASLRLAFN